MIVELSLRSLFRRRSRTLLALAGIAVSAALLLDMTMLANGLTTSFTELTRSQGYGLRLTPRGTLPFDSEAGIERAGEMRRAIQALPEVSSAAPVLGAQLYTVQSESLGEPIFTTGIDPAAQMIYLLVEGADPEPGEIVVSRPLALAYALVPGDSLPLAAAVDVGLGRPLSVQLARVAGVGDFLYDAVGQRSIALPLGDLQRLAGRPDEVSLFAIASDPATDESALAARIEEMFPTVSVYTTAETTEAVGARLAYFRQLSTILGSIALAVAILLVGTIVTIGVRERFHEIATLRAIGVSARRLHMSIIAEGLLITSIGCLAGVPIGIWMASRLDRILLSFPGIPARVSFFVFEPIPAFVALSIVLAAGALAGAIPGRVALRAPLGVALREEAD
jgi:putative ABC transport system permease protein